MKTILFISLSALTITLCSFKTFEMNKVELMRDGNYRIPAGVLKSKDVNHLALITNGTHVRTARIIMPSTNDSGMIVWKILENASSNPELELEVRRIMKKYL